MTDVDARLIANHP